jgi:cytidine deaminase
MFEKLKELLNHSYSPYSNFKVASIVVMKDGHTFSGVNVENASYGAGVCAERSSILSAISHGYKRYDFKEMYVLTSGNKISTSCFLCRQVMSELFEKEVPVHFYDLEGHQMDLLVKDLCPYPFDSEDLK